MLEYVVIDHPPLAPQACVGCTRQQGPTLDMQREILGYGRLYLCLRCAKNAARLFGLVDIGKVDQLEAYAEQVLGLERDLAVLTTERDTALTNFALSARSANTLAERVTELQDRCTHLESRIREEAEVSLSLVGGS